MGGNGGIEPNELELKKKAFEENPDKFICIDDLIIATKKGKVPGQIDTLINSGTRTELEVSIMRLTHQAFGVFNAMSFAQQQANKPKIQKPGGIINFARGGFKR